MTEDYNDVAGAPQELPAGVRRKEREQKPKSGTVGTSLLHDKPTLEPEPERKEVQSGNQSSTKSRRISAVTGAASVENTPLEPELPEREPQWADCPRCHQKVLAPHECYESVLNEVSEREAFEKYAESEGLMTKRYKGKVFRLSYVNGNTDAHWETWQAAYRAGAASNLEINDKSGWEYDPDAALKRVRARVATGKEK
jgi:hypothetical protein